MMDGVIRFGSKLLFGSRTENRRRRESSSADSGRARPSKKGQHHHHHRPKRPPLDPSSSYRPRREPFSDPESVSSSPVAASTTANELNWWQVCYQYIHAAMQVVTDPSFSYRALTLALAALEDYLAWRLFLHLLLVLAVCWIAGRLHVQPLPVLIGSAAYIRSVERRQHSRLVDQLRRDMEDKESRGAPTPGQESAEWLNGLLDKAWPVFLERFISSWLVDCLHINLNYYKPFILKKLLIDALHLGSLPPRIKSLKFYRYPQDGDDCALELDVVYVASDDMKVDLLARFKRTMALGMSGKLYGNNLRIIGKLRLGFRFSPGLPFLGQLRVSFVGQPRLGFSLKPLHAHAIDINDMPGFASWLDKELKSAVRRSMVEPQQLVFDIGKLLGIDADEGASTAPSGHYRCDTSPERRLTGVLKTWRLGSTIKLNTAGTEAYVFVEVLDAKDLPPPDQRSLLDPYVKLKFGRHRCRTSVRKHTLTPAWHELFRLRVPSWEGVRMLRLHVRDRDAFEKDDEIGHCEVDLLKLRGSGRKELWLRLQNPAGRGTLRLAITIIETGGFTTGLQRTSSSVSDDGGSVGMDSRAVESSRRASKASTQEGLEESEDDSPGGGGWWWRTAVKERGGEPSFSVCPKCGFGNDGGRGTGAQSAASSSRGPDPAPPGPSPLSPLEEREDRGGGDSGRGGSGGSREGTGCDGANEEGLGAVGELRWQGRVDERREGRGDAEVTPVRSPNRRLPFTADSFDFRPLSTMMGAGMGLLGRRLKLVWKKASGSGGDKRGSYMAKFQGLGYGGGIALALPGVCVGGGWGSDGAVSDGLATGAAHFGRLKVYGDDMTDTDEEGRLYRVGRGSGFSFTDSKGARERDESGFFGLGDASAIFLPGRKYGVPKRHSSFSDGQFVDVGVLRPKGGGVKKLMRDVGGGASRVFFSPKKKASSSLDLHDVRALEKLKSEAGGSQRTSEGPSRSRSFMPIPTSYTSLSRGCLSPLSNHPLEGPQGPSLSMGRMVRDVPQRMYRSRDDMELPRLQRRRPSGAVGEEGQPGMESPLTSPLFTHQMYLGHVYHSPTAGTLG